MSSDSATLLDRAAFRKIMKPLCERFAGEVGYTDREMAAFSALVGLIGPEWWDGRLARERSRLARYKATGRRFR
mgnify:CR=1 FL=1